MLYCLSIRHTNVNRDKQKTPGQGQFKKEYIKCIDIRVLRCYDEEVMQALA